MASGCINLRERFPDYRLRWDESHVPGQDFDPWLLEIPCKYGRIYAYGGNELCAYTDRPRLLARLKAIPGARVHQEGDFELVVRFHVEDWEPYFHLLRAKRKRTLSPGVRLALQKALDERRRRASQARETRSERTPEPDTSARLGKAS